MKENEQKQNFYNADDCGKNDKNDEILDKPAEVGLTKAKWKRPAEWKSNRGKKNAIEQNMNGNIESNRYERASHAVNREKNRKASAERIGAEYDDNGRYHESRGMNPCCKKQDKNECVSPYPFEKNQKHAAIAETYAVEKAFAAPEMIVV